MKKALIVAVIVFLVLAVAAYANRKKEILGIGGQTDPVLMEIMKRVRESKMSPKEKADHVKILFQMEPAERLTILQWMQWRETEPRPAINMDFQRKMNALSAKYNIFKD